MHGAVHDSNVGGMGMYGHGRYGLSGEDLSLGGLAWARCFGLGRDLSRDFLLFGLWPGVKGELS